MTYRKTMQKTTCRKMSAKDCEHAENYKIITRIYCLYSLSELRQGKAMAADTKYQKRRKEKSERLGGERDEIR